MEQKKLLVKLENDVGVEGCGRLSLEYGEVSQRESRKNEHSRFITKRKIRREVVFESGKREQRVGGELGGGRFRDGFGVTEERRACDD